MLIISAVCLYRIPREKDDQTCDQCHVIAGE